MLKLWCFSESFLVSWRETEIRLRKEDKRGSLKLKMTNKDAVLNLDSEKESDASPTSSSSHSPTPPQKEGTSTDGPSSVRSSKTRVKKKPAKRKAMQLRSNVWKHFTRYLNEKGQKRASCNYFGRDYATNPNNNGTSSIKAHIPKCSNNPEVKSDQSHLYAASNDGEGVLGCWKYDDNAIRKALAFMVIVDEVPFKFIESEGFKKLMYAACPRFHMPSRFTVARDCFAFYSDEKTKLKKYFKSSSMRISLTTDTWTSIQRVNYLCLTAHYIDDGWKLQKRILAFVPITSHKGIDIGLIVENCLREWELYRILAITVDNAGSNNVAVDYLRKQILNWKSGIVECKYLHMRCVAHIVNLIVTDGLKEFNESVERVRDAIRFVRNSPARLSAFKECVKIERIDSKSLLCLDVSTRWNSTYMMLETAQKFEKAFERFGMKDMIYITELESNNGVPVSADWENVRSLVSFLETFYDLTCRISGSLYVTSNRFFLEISEVEGLLQRWQSHENKTFASMAKKMKVKYDKYWGDVQQVNMLIYIAVVLDPQYKLGFVEFSLDAMYVGNEHIGVALKRKVRDALHELYDAYKAIIQPRSTESCSKSQESVELRVEKKMKYTVLELRLREFEHATGTVENKTELERYLSEPREKRSSSFDVLMWWKMNCQRYPVVGAMARDILATPITTVASESAFSTGGRVLDQFRSSLTPKTVETLICTQDWLRSMIRDNVEEEVEDLEKLEADVSKLTLC